MTFIKTNARTSIRLNDYEYSQPGEYFVTICTHNHKCIFGEVVNEEIHLSKEGEIVKEEWSKTPKIRPEIKLDVFTIMPNHIHGIIIIKDESIITKVGTHGRASLQRQPRSLGSFVAGFKSVTTKRINIFRKIPHAYIWQKRFYDHIIRNEKDLNNIRDYIINNPLKWSLDEENPK